MGEVPAIPAATGIMGSPVHRRTQGDLTTCPVRAFSRLPARLSPFGGPGCLQNLNSPVPGTPWHAEHRGQSWSPGDALSQYEEIADPVQEFPDLGPFPVQAFRTWYCIFKTRIPSGLAVYVEAGNGGGVDEAGVKEQGDSPQSSMIARVMEAGVGHPVGVFVVSACW